VNRTDFFILPRSCQKEIFAHVITLLPEEACGLIAGQDLNAKVVFPVTNRLHRTDRFEMDPQAQWQALMWMDQNQMELTGIFHSHPQGPSYPSETDIKEYAYPETLAIICFLEGAEWRMRGFWVVDGKVKEQVIRIVG
jgi:[CysO sulfur-carrier protein]-S-L-cysteine hydrolase